MSLVDSLLRLTRLDFNPSRRPPSILLSVIGLVVGVVLSLLANVLIAHVAIALDPSLSSYPHFQISDYGRLTVVGALIACVGWPILTRVSSAPLLLYVVIAILGTLVLFLPDLYILVALQEPVHAVLGLVVMHIAVPLCSCTSMVLIGRAPRSPK